MKKALDIPYLGKLPPPIHPSSPHWLRDVLDPQYSNPFISYIRRKVIFLDTDKVPAPDSRIGEVLRNETEAELVSLVSYPFRLTLKMTNALLLCGVKTSSLGVISPYRSQLKLLRSLISNSALEIHTVDKFQGRDKDAVLISFVRSNPRKMVIVAIVFIPDWRTASRLEADQCCLYESKEKAYYCWF